MQADRLGEGGEGEHEQHGDRKQRLLAAEVLLRPGHEFARVRNMPGRVANQPVHQEHGSEEHHRFHCRDHDRYEQAALRLDPQNHAEQQQRRGVVLHGDGHNPLPDAGLEPSKGDQDANAHRERRDGHAQTEEHHLGRLEPEQIGETVADRERHEEAADGDQRSAPAERLLDILELHLHAGEHDQKKHAKVGEDLQFRTWLDDAEH